VTPEEAVQPLWRGMRGELPRGFWVPDKTGMVCAVESPHSRAPTLDSHVWRVLVSHVWLAWRVGLAML
jgi:hypothetical protein